MRLSRWDDTLGIVIYWAVMAILNGAICVAELRAFSGALFWAVLWAVAFGWNLRGYVQGKAREIGL